MKGIVSKRLKRWKTFDKGFSKYVGEMLWKFYDQNGIPPEILADYVLEDNKRIKALMTGYYMQYIQDNDKQKKEKKLLIINKVEKMSNVQIDWEKHIFALTAKQTEV